MKQAKSLLAIWLALILVLAFAPTAWADGNAVTFSLTGCEKTAGEDQFTAESEYTATFTAKSGYTLDNNSVSVTATPDTPITPTVEPSSDGSSATVTFTVPANTTALTITVTAKAGEQNIVYDANLPSGATGSVEHMPSDAKENTGASYTIDASTPTLTGYTFMGWKVDGDSQLYQPSGSITVPAGGLTLKAQWGYTITYDPADGVSSTTTANCAVGESCTLANAPTYAGNTFLGWKTADGTLLAAGASYTPTANVTLTAQWAKTVNIIYKEGDPLTESTEAKYEGYELTVKEPDASKTPSGKLFTGWSGSDGKTYQPGTKITLGANPLTLTAQYADKVTISFATGTTVTVNGMPSNMEVEQGKNFTAPKAPSRNDSYAFKGWKASWDGKIYQAGATVTAPTAATGTMTAQWEKVYYPDYDEDDDDDDDDNSGTVTTYYSIDVSCSSGGTVFPSGTNSVKKGNSLTVTWAPQSGYVIDGVYIDGVLDNSHDGSYTFRNVTESHTLYVRYVRDSGSSGGSSGSDDTSPKTGDSSLPMGVLLGVGALALTALVVARKRSRA